MAFGSVLSSASDNPDARKERGAFFTPPELAAYLADWAITSRHDRVLEPACGEAEFLIASFYRLVSLGASEDDASERIDGCELHADSAKAALARCSELFFKPTICIGDFFRKEAESKYDVVIGNPPYVRFQVIDRKQKESIRAVTSNAGFAVSALASAWAPFVMHSASFLKEGGKIAFVLPAELLSVNYAAPIRTFLLSEFADISIVTFDEQVFPEVQEEVVLLLASGYHQGSSRQIKWIQSPDLSQIGEGCNSSYRPGQNGERWTAGFISPDVASLMEELDGGAFCRLGNWGSLALGTVTGCNNYFVLSESEAQNSGLSKDELREVLPPGSGHLRRLVFSKSDYDHLVRQGKKTFLFYPGAQPTTAAQHYIDNGVLNGIDQRYKCRKRSPWWKVPLVQTPDAFITYMNDFAPSVCINDANLLHLNSVHGLTFHEKYRELGRELFSLACANSVTLLSSEIEGRTYGGGLLKVEPREAARLQVPSQDLVRLHHDSLLALLKDAPGSLSGSDLFSLSAKVDEILFGSNEACGAVQLGKIRDAKERLYERRRNRGRRRA